MAAGEDLGTEPVDQGAHVERDHPAAEVERLPELHLLEPMGLEPKPAGLERRSAGRVIATHEPDERVRTTAPLRRVARGAGGVPQVPVGCDHRHVAQQRAGDRVGLQPVECRGERRPEQFLMVRTGVLDVGEQAVEEREGGVLEGEHVGGLVSS